MRRLHPPRMPPTTPTTSQQRSSANPKGLHWGKKQGPGCADLSAKCAAVDPIQKWCTWRLWASSSATPQTR